jgi:hypothetical protein
MLSILYQNYPAKRKIIAGLPGYFLTSEVSFLARRLETFKSKFVLFSSKKCWRLFLKNRQHSRDKNERIFVSRFSLSKNHVFQTLKLLSRFIDKISQLMTFYDCEFRIFLAKRGRIQTL